MAYVAVVRLDDEITIGTDVKIRFPDQANVGRGQVRVVIDAPRDKEILHAGRSKRADMLPGRYAPRAGLPERANPAPSRP